MTTTPDFDGHGNLPAGVHPMTIEEVHERFAWNSWRDELFDGIAEVCELLKAAGCPRVWLGGSYVTTKELPGDFDLAWDVEFLDSES